MLTVASRRGPLRDRLVYFAGPDEAGAIADGVLPHEVIRFRHALADLRRLRIGVAVLESRTSRIDLALEPEALLGGMDAKSCRYEIRRAEKLADRVTIDSGERARGDFLGLYNAFVSWKGYTHPMSARRYEQYGAVSDVHVAYLDGEPLVAHLLLRDDAIGRVRLAFSASVRRDAGEAGRAVGPVNRHLHWQEILMYRAQGFHAYDFGGIGDGTGPVGRFKLSFGGAVEVGYTCMVAGALARLPVTAFERLGGVRSALARRRVAVSRRQLRSARS